LVLAGPLNVKIKELATRKEKNYTSWLDGARKDVVRAFSVLKNTWQFLDRPILLHDLADISNRVICCLLLHILVTDRGLLCTTTERHMILQSGLLLHWMKWISLHIQVVQAANACKARTVIGINNAHPAVQAAMTRSERFTELNDPAERIRLHKAPINKFNVEFLQSLLFLSDVFLLVFCFIDVIAVHLLHLLFSLVVINFHGGEIHFLIGKILGEVHLLSSEVHLLKRRIIFC
jgi:hypothetical protein